MSHILHIDSSIFGADGTSSTLAAEFVARQRSADPTITVTRRDLGSEPPPHLDADTFSAFLTAPDDRSPHQQKLAQLSDDLVAELQAADTLVLGVPMYNFQVPSALKAWFDHVARAGITFRYTADGPEGLLTGKRAYVFAARGGMYSADQDTQTPYVRQFLGFLGITDVTISHAEGLAMGDEAREQGLAQARTEIHELTRQAA